ncbi:MAG: SRPBCC family protein [Bradymonadaceae bacterium]|nr:SRPBCC family protein [Lujinxingiaceae bacterium]
MPPEELWRLIKEAFQEPSRSPIWPVDVDEVEPVELMEGAMVQATYKLGPLKARPSYSITRFEPGRSFSYESNPSHPLQGGATVVVEPREAMASALRWYGSYRPRLHPMAPGALLFVRLYFLRTFFAGLEEKLRVYEQIFGGEERQAVSQPR